MAKGKNERGIAFVGYVRSEEPIFVCIGGGLGEEHYGTRQQARTDLLRTSLGNHRPDFTWGWVPPPGPDLGRALVDALPETRWQLALIIIGIHGDEFTNREATVSGGGGRHCSVGTHSLWSH